ncbi:ShlB/FhaC/HecB family hemolysin secretion/activation protein [Novosphingobium lentum]|uniref:ShlB/FhaC/HecB family hemolysin secretion/activation protein n=1 Tax=Novosphingobium lentum TaxID=145287 RepID=UPI000832D25C|nr:ShlB/FhaC/HecB family hemolysin secretion/activation protein [Novosphingobium lentum]
MTNCGKTWPRRRAAGLQLADPTCHALNVGRFGVGMLLAAALQLGCAASAVAQVAAPPPAALPPGATPPTREEVERGVAEGTLNRGQAVAVDTSAVERAPCPLAAPEFAGIRLKIGSVTFSGLDAVPGEDLSGTWREYVGTDQPVGVICEIRDRAATQLRSEGYLAAVQVPPQKIADGQVRLDVLFARMTKVQIKGDAGASEGLLLRYLNKLTAEPVFNTDRAERYLLLAKDIPGLDVRLALRPIEGSPGEVIGEISVRRVPVFADFTVQNYGSKAIGRFNGLARAQINGLTGLGDATTASFFTTADFDEQKVLQVGHEMRLGGEGFTLRGDFTYGWTHPTVPNNLQFHSRTLVASLEGDYPFIRRQSHNLSGAIGFDLINQDVDFGAIPFNQDRLRVLFARIDMNGIAPESLTGHDGFTPTEPHYNWGLSLELRKGLGIFDATPECAGNAGGCLGAAFIPPSRIGTARGFVVRASGEFDYRPVRDITVSVAPRLQYSPDALLSYEQISGGNYTVGRGYDPGAIIGDSGVGVRSEFRVGSIVPKTPGASAFQPYVFFDAAWVWNHNRIVGVPDPQKLYSVGGGVRATLLEAFRVDADVAVPLRNVVGQAVKGDVRFLINVSMQLSPWKF